VLWTSAGIGAACGITFAVFGVLNNQKLAELESKGPEGRCATDPGNEPAGDSQQVLSQPDDLRWRQVPVVRWLI
jgi:hypothetical protein